MAVEKAAGKKPVARKARVAKPAPIETAAAPASVIEAVAPAKPARAARAAQPSALLAALNPQEPAVEPATAIATVETAAVEAPVIAQPEAQAAPEPVAEAAAPQPAPKTEDATPQTFQTGAKIMTDTFQQAAAPFQNAFGGVNEQAKSAMEKSTRIVEELTDLTRGNIEALVASQKTAAKYAETLGQNAAEYSRRSFEEATTAFKSFAEVKSPTDFFRLQSEFARSAFDQLVAESAKVSETVVKATGDVVEPLTSRYAVAAERIKTLAA